MMTRIVAGVIFTLSMVTGTAFADSIGTVNLLLPNGAVGDPVNVTPVGSTTAISTFFGPYDYTLSNPSNAAVATLLGANPSNGNSVTVGGFCISLTTGITTGTLYSNFAVQPIATSGPNTGMLGGLSATQTTDVLKLMFDYTAAHGSLTNPSGSSSTLNDALGAAIWEATDGKGTDSPNAFVVNGGANDIKVEARGSTSSATITAAVNLANSWLAGLATQTQEENPADVFALVGFDKYGNPLQTQAIVLCPPPVPEPGTAVGLASLSLMGLVATCLTFVRRNRNGLRECEGGRRVSELAQNIA